jgi:hypothetical protein
MAAFANIIMPHELPTYLANANPDTILHTMFSADQLQLFTALNPLSVASFPGGLTRDFIGRNLHGPSPVPDREQAWRLLCMFMVRILSAPFLVLQS